MKKYRSEVRSRTLSQLPGFASRVSDLLNDTESMLSLDDQISVCAGQELSPAELSVFFILYSCQPAWKEVVEIYNAHIDAVVAEASVKRSSQRAVTKILRAIDRRNPSSEGLRKWKPK